MTDREIVLHLIEIEQALNGGKELVSNQGQALDGISALANFVDLAKEAAAHEAKKRAPEWLKNLERDYFSWFEGRGRGGVNSNADSN